MTEREFQRLMTVYGADIGRWPACRQAAAEKWQAAHPEARQSLRRTAEIDRLLRNAGPRIDPVRADRSIERMLRRTAHLSRPRPGLTWPRFAWPEWRWAPRGAVYLGLFILGCAANLAVRLLATDTPLDLWFSGNLTLPLGG
jgi:ferric-dicitrate binding protein FerR (iron transport regulator)